MNTLSNLHTTLRMAVWAALLLAIQWAVGLKKANAQPVPVKNIVLVHGAFAVGSGWKAVYERLTERKLAPVWGALVLSGIKEEIPLPLPRRQSIFPGIFGCGG